LKFKIKYLYLIVGLGVIVTLIILSRGSKEPTASVNQIEGQEMPNDSVHKGLKNPVGENPSKSNVSSEVYHKMDMLKKAVEENPNDTAKMKTYADFMTAAHKPEDAIPYYEKILKADPGRNDILFSLAMLTYNKQDYDKAEFYTNQILKNDKNNTQAMFNLGAIAASKGDKEKAKQIWNKLIQNYPDDETAQLAKTAVQKL
jgi:cytochrome c-type biogenesis protein CcmH/NrfG